MIVIPKDKPVFEGLNASYLKMEKLLEHFQGALGSGAVHLYSPSEEGAIFFDSDALLGGIFQSGQEDYKGQQAIERLLNLAGRNDFSVGVYEIGAGRVLYWASIPFAQPVYSELSSEFTDLEGLIQTQRSQSLTGFIAASLGSSREEGLLFFNSGELIGGAYSWTGGDLEESPDYLDELFGKVQEEGAVFNVYKIEPQAETLEPETIEGSAREESAEPGGVYPMLEELLAGMNSVVSSEKKIKDDFSTLLRKKFLEKAEEYYFLDPFAAEVEYENGKLTNYGSAGDEEVARGIMDAIKEMARELKVEDRLRKELQQWSSRYGDYLSKLGLEL